MACCGVSFLLGFALPYRPGASSFFGPFGPAVCRCSYACALHVVVVLLRVVVGASSVFGIFLVFSPSLLPPFISLQCLLLFIIAIIPLSSQLCVTRAWAGAGFGGRDSWLGCG